MKKYLVAVYGSLRKTMSNHQYYLSDSEYKGTFSTEPEYTLHSLQWYPGLKLNGNTSVVMEVYEVDEKTLTNLNRLEGIILERNQLFMIELKLILLGVKLLHIFM